MTERQFQSLSREKPFCHFYGDDVTAKVVYVSIAQSRKALLPHCTYTHYRASHSRFQSLSREKPFCHIPARFAMPLTICQFQSLSREKPFFHSFINLGWFQSLSREKPFCHQLLPLPQRRRKQVSIAQSRKALLPPFTSTPPRPILASFNRSVAKSPFATTQRPCVASEQKKVSIAQSRKALLPPVSVIPTPPAPIVQFQSLSREKPFCHVIVDESSYIKGYVSIAQSRKALLPPS